MQKNKECFKSIVHVRQDGHNAKTEIRSGRDSNSRRIAPLALKASAFDHSATAAGQFRLATTIKGIARATPLVLFWSIIICSSGGIKN